MEKLYTVPNMKCEGCASNIKNALKAVDGVQELAIDVAQKTVGVVFDEVKTNDQVLQKALVEAGYPAV